VVKLNGVAIPGMKGGIVVAFVEDIVVRSVGVVPADGVVNTGRKSKR
jgi:hypothetical protein